MLAFVSIACLALLAAPTPQAPGGATPLAPGGGLSAGTPRPGTLVPKPGGGSFLQDLHRGGRGGELGLVEVRWGRLVDVHALDASGAPEEAPVFRDVLIDPNLLGDGRDYELRESPITRVTRLVVRRTRASAEFVELLLAAERATVPLEPRDLSAPVHALVPRNAALALRFDDLLADDPAAALALLDDVQVRAGQSPLAPHAARVRFDANHGGVVGGAFHSTRVLVDLALSAFEARELAVPLPLSPAGVPAGAPQGASLVLRLPTRTAPGAGQFTVLRNLAGRPLAQQGNGPLDESVPTADLVRAARAGNDADPERGFLLDRTPPRLVGHFPLAVQAALDDPAGEPGFAFLLDWSFTSPCFARPLAGDGLALGDELLEVVANGPVVSGSGAVSGVRVRLAGTQPATAAALLGNGRALVPWRPSALASACWVEFRPAPLAPPAAGVSPDAFVVAHFSEAMAEATLDPYATFALVHGTAAPTAETRVPAEVFGDSDLGAFALTPLLPLAHAAGTATAYALALGGNAQESPEDLAGNRLTDGLAASFTLDPSAPSEASGGLVHTFTGFDELPPLGRSDLRGAYFLDFVEGAIQGRPAARFSAYVERTNPVTSLQIPYMAGVATPLTPLGAKLQRVWRYADLGWGVRDESKYDVDVVGMDWSPLGGTVVNDFFPRFEILFAHARNLPDEDINAFLLPRFPASGLPGTSVAFDQNPLGPQALAHARERGYAVRAADVHLSPNGTPLAPYPLLDAAGRPTGYTWRDTSLALAGGPNGTGVPLGVEVGPPLDLEPAAGTLAPSGAVPSIGLPLLVEYRCFPAASALGLNRHSVNLAINSSALPAFRAYSAGGINRFGQPVAVDPDLETHPQGGFNPSSTPPGQRTFPNDDVVYLGGLDLAYRVSRAHSAWIDLGASGVDLAALQVRAGALPPGTRLEVVARGATGFAGGGDPFDASAIDAYGALEVGTVEFLGGSDAWQSDLDALDGARYVQLRVTFTNDLDSGASPSLDALALAFRR